MIINNLFNDIEYTKFVESDIISIDESIKHSKQEVIKEHRTKVYVNGNQVMTLLCTASYLDYLVIGRLISEGMIHNINNIEKLNICEYGLRAQVSLKPNIKLDIKTTQDEVGSCCTDNQSLFKTETLPSPITNQKHFNPKDIFEMAAAFHNDSKLHKLTQGTHAAYLFLDKKIIFDCEDIGCHNALDKIIGYIYLNKLNLKIVLYSPQVLFLLIWHVKQYMLILVQSHQKPFQPMMLYLLQKNII